MRHSGGCPMLDEPSAWQSSRSSAPKALHFARKGCHRRHCTPLTVPKCWLWARHTPDLASGGGALPSLVAPERSFRTALPHGGILVAGGRPARAAQRYWGRFSADRHGAQRQRRHSGGVHMDAASPGIFTLTSVATYWRRCGPCTGCVSVFSKIIGHSFLFAKSGEARPSSALMAAS